MPSYTTRALQWADIDQTLPSVQKLEAFKNVVDFAIAEGAQVVDVAPSAKNWIQLLENFYWRAEDLYILKTPDRKVSPCDVYHPTIHYLFVKKYGATLEGRPLATLLAESLASMSEYYFALESLLKFGFGGLHENIFIRTLADFEAKRLGVPPSPQVDARVLGFLHSEHADPYAAYRRGSLEMFEFFRFMYSAGVKRIGGEKTDFAKYVERCEKLRYGSLILRFFVGLNVADALAHGGRTSTPEDQEAILDCLTKLKKAESFREFLASMGMTTAATEAA